MRSGNFLDQYHSVYYASHAHRGMFVQELTCGFHFDYVPLNVRITYEGQTGGGYARVSRLKALLG